MPVYSCKLVLETLNEICRKFEQTKNLHVKKVKLTSDKNNYQATLTMGGTRLIEIELIKEYIESFGEKKALAIAGRLIHDNSLEESVHKPKQPEIDEYWNGDITEIDDYIRKRDNKNTPEQ